MEEVQEVTDLDQKERRRRNLLAKRLRSDPEFRQRVVDPKPSKYRKKKLTKKDILKSYWKEEAADG